MRRRPVLSREWNALPLAFAIMLAACATTTEQVIAPGPPTFAAPLIEPVRLRVAYSFDASVDDEVVYRQGPSDHPHAIYHLRLGPATRAGLGRVLATLFPGGAAAAASPGDREGLDGLIRVRLLRAYVAHDAGDDSGHVTYELDLLHADGTPIATWKVLGEGRGLGDDGNVALAIRAAAATVARDLPQQPTIQAWLEATRSPSAGEAR